MNKKPESARKQSTLYARVTDDFHAKMKHAANYQNEGISRFLRRLVNEYISDRCESDPKFAKHMEEGAK